MGKPLKQHPKILLPREKLVAHGVSRLADHELLAILLRSGTQGRHVLNLARTLLQRHEMKSLVNCSYAELVQLKGVSQAKACTLLASFELAKRALDLHDPAIPRITTVYDVIGQLNFIRLKKKEYFVALFLNARDQLIGREVISVGTLDASLIHPREVFQPALLCNAARLFIAHNHPSGDPQPSAADITITRRMLKAGKIMGVTVRDHIIIADKRFFSFSQERLLHG